MSALDQPNVSVKPAAGSPRPTRPTPWLVWGIGIGVPIAAAWSALNVGAKWSTLFGGFADGVDVFRLMAKYAEFDHLTKSLSAMWDSVAMAWLGTLLAACIAAPLGFLAAENLVPRWMSFVMRQIFNALRSIPEIIIVIAMVPLFGLTKMSGIMALAIGSIGTLSKLSSEIVENVDKGPIEAGEAVGATTLQRLRWSVLPQVLPEMASLILYRFEINIRVSAILGAVGAGGIGAVLRDAFQFKEWGLAGMGLVVVIVATMIIDTISGWVRRRILAGPGVKVSEVSAADLDPEIRIDLGAEA